MLRHLFLFAAAPGRHVEAESALREWLTAVRSAPQLRGAAVMRARMGEFGDMQPPYAVTYDVTSRDEGLAFKDATSAVPNPMAEDIPGAVPFEQGAVLFGAADPGHEHAKHGDGAHPHLGVSPDGVANLKYDRGGGLLARLLRVHFEVLDDFAPLPAAAKSPEQ